VNPGSVAIVVAPLAAILLSTCLPSGAAQSVRTRHLAPRAGRSQLTASSDRDAVEGRRLFHKVWTPSDGLGPAMNAQSCLACHGEPVAGGHAAHTSQFVLIAKEDAGQTRIFQRFLLRALGAVVQRPIPQQVAQRRPPPLFGLGVLEAAAQSSANGRFGWTARFRTIDEAVEAAFRNELGLTGPGSAAADGDTGRPEITAEHIALVSQFIRLLPPPRPIREPQPSERRVFERTGCASCHQPELRTGFSPIPAISNKVIHGYTDLKLHDLGPALRDPWAGQGEEGSAFRTPPLWGLGTLGPPYLHDGRASTIDEAIRLHDGEAATSAATYLQLSTNDRELLLEFLRTR
jgi:CxxC motif-containing protein (DUF1111 family)